jgi:hypothetical protein
MPSHRGLTCNLQMKNGCDSDYCLDKHSIEPVPTVHILTDFEDNSVTTSVAVKPGWFNIVLEVNEFISEYLVV